MKEFKEVFENNIRLFKNPETGNIREPRFDMPNKEGYQNDKIRIIKRIGRFQSMLEIYDLSETHQFIYFRIPNNENMIAALEQVFQDALKHYGLEITDILPNNFIEYKANFFKGYWIEPKNK